MLISSHSSRVMAPAPPLGLDARADVPLMRLSVRPLVKAAQVGAFMLVTALVGVSVNGGTRRDAIELLRYRSTLQELSDALYTMHWRALSQRRIVELRVNESRSGFQVVAIEGRPRVEIIERTIWLPQGLQLLDVPERVTVDRAGRLPTLSLALRAASHNLLFRLTVTPAGVVQVREEPTL